MLRHAMLTPARRRPRDQSDEGAVAVEFALILPLLVLFLFGILQFGLFFFRLQGLQSNAIEGARGASIGLTVEEITKRVQNTLTVPLSWDDVEVAITLVDTTGATADQVWDGKSVDPLVLAHAPCRDIAAPEDHQVRVNLSIDKEDQKYQVIIPIWGTLKINYGSVGVYGCEFTS